MSDSTITGSGSASRGDAAPARASRSGSRPALGDVKELGGQLASAARNRANSIYEEQRDRAATEISALGGSLERSAKSLNGTIGETLAPYAEDAARQVEGFADTLRDKSLSDVGKDVEGFARSWPMAFVAAAVGAGFIAGRFLLSSGNPIDVVAGHKSHDAEGPRAPKRLEAREIGDAASGYTGREARSGAGGK